MDYFFQAHRNLLVKLSAVMESLSKLGMVALGPEDGTQTVCIVMQEDNTTACSELSEVHQIVNGEPQVSIFGEFHVPLYDSERHMELSQRMKIPFTSPEYQTETRWDENSYQEFQQQNETLQPQMQMFKNNL